MKSYDTLSEKQTVVAPAITVNKYNQEMEEKSDMTKFTHDTLPQFR